MSRLLYLTAVLVSITCCSLLSSATAEDTKLVQLGKEETLALGHSRDIREAGNGKNLKNKNDKNGESGKRPKKRRNGNKKLSRKDKKGSRKRQNERKRNNSPKRQRQRTKQKKNREEKKRPKGKKDKKKDKKKKNRGEKDRPRSEKRKKQQKKRRTQKGRNEKKYDNVKGSRLQSDSCVQTLNDLLGLGIRDWTQMSKKGKRALANNEITWKKVVKRVWFLKPFHYLYRATGRSINTPTCRGVTIPATNPQVKDFLDTLNNCDTKLQSVCKPLLQKDITKEIALMDCSLKYDTLDTVAYTAIKVGRLPADVCIDASLFPTRSEKPFTDVETCLTDMTKLDLDTKAYKKICLDEFRKCRKAERNVARIIRRCSSRIDPVPLIKWIETKLSVQIGFRQLLTPTLFPKPRTWTFSPKQTNRSACLEILEAWKAFNASAMAATQSVEGPTDEDALDQALAIIESIIERNNIDDELFECMNATDNSVFEQISLYTNWSIIWIDTVIDPKIDYLTELQNNETTCSTSSTVNTAEVTNSTSDSSSTLSVNNSTTVSSSTLNVTNSTSDSTSTPTVTTVSPTGRRAHFLKEMKKIKIV